jgi:hypothetical protein
MRYQMVDFIKLDFGEMGNQQLGTRVYRNLIVKIELEYYSKKSDFQNFKSFILQQS